jgi:hypothetical protein
LGLIADNPNSFCFPRLNRGSLERQPDSGSVSALPADRSGVENRSLF